MLNDIGNDLKNILLAGVGAVAFTAEKSAELVKELVKKGELTVEQGKALSEELKRKYREANPQPQEGAGAVDVEHMSREEREALRRKLESLEAQEMERAEETNATEEPEESE